VSCPTGPVGEPLRFGLWDTASRLPWCHIRTGSALRIVSGAGSEQSGCCNEVIFKVASFDLGLSSAKLCGTF